MEKTATRQHLRPGLRFLQTLGLALLLSLASCCSIGLGLASLFCGPSREPWTVEDYATPRDAIGTFLGAVARKDKSVLYRCLSGNWKKRNGVGRLELEVVWQRLEQQARGLHLLGQRAKVTGPDSGPDGLVRFRLSLHSYHFEVSLRQQSYWSTKVLWTDENGQRQTRADGDLLDDLGEVIRIDQNDDDRTPILVNVPGPELPGISPADVVEVTAGREWKIDDLRPVSDKDRLSD